MKFYMPSYIDECTAPHTRLNLDDIALMSSEVFEFILRNYDLRKVL
jgi:hypothetical protein